MFQKNLRLDFEITRVCVAWVLKITCSVLYLINSDIYLLQSVKRSVDAWNFN